MHFKMIECEFKFWRYCCGFTALADDAALLAINMLLLLVVALLVFGKYKGPLNPQAVRKKAVSKKAMRTRIVAWL
nr:hypothetical protein [uncultured Deefgea sp.]